MSDLIERLRQAATVLYQTSQTADSPEEFMEWEAADALEAKDAEISELNEALVAKDDAELDAYAQLVRVNGNMKTENDRLTAELEKETAEKVRIISERTTALAENARLREALEWVWASAHQDVTNDQIREYLRPILAEEALK